MYCFIEGGKVEVYNVDTGDQLLSVKTHDDPVSAVKVSGISVEVMIVSTTRHNNYALPS